MKPGLKKVVVLFSLSVAMAVTVATVAMRHSVFAPQKKASPSLDTSTAQDIIPHDSPESWQIMQSQKDQNIYYTPGTYQKIVKMAYSGDEWAIREMAWPEGHKFHERGRPFFRNHEPHPEGLIPHTGY